MHVVDFDVHSAEPDLQQNKTLNSKLVSVMTAKNTPPTLMSSRILSPQIGPLKTPIGHFAGPFSAHSRPLVQNQALCSHSTCMYFIEI